MRFANYYQQDRIKNDSFAEVDRHHTYNPTFTNRLLRLEFLKHGIELNNPDVNEGRPIVFSILHDGQALEQIANPKYLIATENPYICPRNQDRSYLLQFDGVFTWNTNFADLPNISHLFIPNQIRCQPTPAFSERPIFSCIINANKAFPKGLKNDLYRERLEVIRWYEKNAPAAFSLYGLGWNKPAPAFSAPEKVTRRFMRLASQLFGYRPFPSYAGEVVDKESIYRKTKFAYCYENVANLPDYISEKIFDCFFGGCVPIYWGSHTIDEHIPQSCFIDRRNFKNTAEVHRYLLSIDEQQYAQYQENIRQFLMSPKAMEFDTTTYVSTIVTRILGDLRHDQ
ncbi:glycosyltransferase family 10 [Polynucleobacter sp. HIN6]|uniref:glycosyltransferase family 10 domain-containing protein n=1 Tax=Polynucleobacter sp. HIN6 TaxID=3047865 RepID=UPI0025741341|nr:glycosyltransferase family 10 [Polynucleobacter sp. HIN6]BEI34765.1 glycosyltransferase family 10 [Polynucleobacter sp. HIN6]